MTLPEVVAAAALAALVLYALFGGADFGAGVWDLLATGPRAAEQRALLDRAIAPVWEANHVWLILLVVLLFTGFPAAFSVACIALHVPLTMMLFGIVLRGSAFVFRKYGGEDARRRLRWGRVFAVASTITPVFLGVILGAVTAGTIHVRDGLPASGYFAPWLRPFPFAVGALALAACAFLAATFAAAEARDAALRDDFRARALAASAAVAATAVAAALSARSDAAQFRAALAGSWWSAPLLAAAAAAALGAAGALLRRRFLAARLLAAAEVAIVLAGWGLAQRPYLVAPDVTIAGAAAPDATLRLLVGALALGSVLLFPSLLYLYGLFFGAVRRRNT